MDRIGSPAYWFVLVVGTLVFSGGGSWVLRDADKVKSNADARSRTSTNVIVGSESAVSRDGNRVANHEVIIRKPAGPPRVDLGVLDEAGRPSTAACSTCHSTRPPNHANRTPADLDEFHQSLAFAHGKVSCLSCHNPDDYDTLRLADATPVEYADVMELCSQCHGPQTRDYRHGAHGGMNGYWDLARGSRTRNNCVDCHDPHSPRFPAMRPTFKPRDRFLSGDDSSGTNQHE